MRMIWSAPTGFGGNENLACFESNKVRARLFADLEEIVAVNGGNHVRLLSRRSKLTPIRPPPCR
jgi:hypothetical protein